MTVKIEGINRIFWKLAKSQDEVTYDLIREKVIEFVQYGIPDQIADYECYNLVACCIGDAIQQGLIKNHAFVDAMKGFHPDPIWMSIFREAYCLDKRSIELKLIHSLLGMIRYVRVKDGDNILVDFGQYDNLQAEE
jgi:hypothetical protein